MSSEGTYVLPYVTIVVPTWNRAELLASCIDSLRAQDYPAERFELIVVDDGSVDETAETVARRARSDGPPVQYLARSHLGVNASRNAGLRAARGELIAFVDDDESAPPGYLRAAVELFLASDASGVGGPVRESSEARVRTCSRCSLGDAGIPVASRQAVDRLLGGNMVLHKRVFEMVGEFDESISGRGDEAEWFSRAAALLFVYDPDLVLSHRRDTMSLLALSRSQFRQGRALPRVAAKTGTRYRPSPLRLLTYLVHAGRNRCGRGVILAAREAGAAFELVRHSR